MNIPVFPTREYQASFISNGQAQELNCQARNINHVKQIIRAQDPLAIIKIIMTQKGA